MWFHSDFDGIKIFLKISNYKNTNPDNWDEEWCYVDMTVQSKNWLNYKQSGELLECYEIDIILSQLEALTENKIVERTEIDFLEPDLKLILIPILDNDTNTVIYYEAEFQVFFWNDGLTDNYLSLHMYDDDIDAFIIYLKYVTRKISKTDPSLQKLLDCGILLKY